MKLNLIKKIVTVFILVLTFSSCKKDPVDPGNGGGGGPVPPPPVFGDATSIRGIVTDENKIPLGGVKVSSGTVSTVSAADGKFLLNNVPAPQTRITVTAEKDGYFDATTAATASKGKTIQVAIMMPKRDVVISFNSTAGATGNVDGAAVKIPANGVVNKDGSPFTGTVQMVGRYIDPESPSLAQLMPGGDFIATDKNQQTVSLYTYGAVEVELQSTTGQELQLKAGSEATLTMPIAPSQIATAPNTIPLWFFDNEKGRWIEEGFATKQGNKYVGTVKHFTPWNCDQPGATSYIQGELKGCDGKPLKNATVETGQSLVFADEDGFYSLAVQSGFANTMIVRSGTNEDLQFDSIPIPPLEAQKTFKKNFTKDCPVVVTGQVINPDKGAVPNARVFVFGGEIQKSATTDINGKFSIQLPPNRRFTLSISTGSRVIDDIDFQTPKDGIKDLGKLELIVPTGDKISSVSFSLDGFGFNNKKFEGIYDFQDGDHEGVYQTSTGTSLIISTFDDFDFTVSFKGHKTGEFSNSFLYIQLRNDKSLQLINSKIKITRYDGLGGMIQGNFSGDFDYIDDLTDKKIGTVKVKNGQFSLHYSEDVP